MAELMPQLPPIIFMYLGRKGSLGEFTLELADAAHRASDCRNAFIVSEHSDLGEKLTSRRAEVYTVPTFSAPSLTNLTMGFVPARRILFEHLAALRPRAIVNLMPHVWTPLLVRGIQKRGIKFVTIIHDAVPHPGDGTARITNWLLREAGAANHTVTLSRAVAKSLIERQRVSGDRVTTLFHPDLKFSSSGRPRMRDPNRPLRLLFFGRIMAYKGLDLLVEAVSSLRREGVGVQLGVAGSGVIKAETLIRLEQLGAEVINRWIADEEISSILERYDAVACAHTEASQSGVAATAFGHAMPVVAMPVGGISEQVIDGKTGVMARGVSLGLLADAIRQLASEPSMLEALSNEIISSAGERSMDRLLEQLSLICQIPSLAENGR
jgi:glycosyltransferase involved in cell wall biosynthesis